MMDHMSQVRHRFVLFPLFMFPVGLMLSSHSAESFISRAGLTCAYTKLVSYGFTSPQLALAEMEAIIMWQNTAKMDHPGYDKWPLAQGRKMKCHLIKNSTHYQCLVSARPCRMKKAKANIS